MGSGKKLTAGGRLSWLAVCFLLLLQGCVHHPEVTEHLEEDRSGVMRPSGMIRAGYLASWTVGKGRFSLDEVPVEHLTHLIYAFAEPDVDGSLKILEPPFLPDGSNGVLPALGSLRKGNPGLRIFLSLGGWNNSGNFSLVARDPARRQVFRDSVAAMLGRFDLDGVDLDWEFPVDGGDPGNFRDSRDADNLALLVSELHDSFLSAGRGWGISMAVSPLARHLDRLDPDMINRCLEFASAMTYNYRGHWNHEAGHASSLSDVKDLAVRWKSRGLMPSRLVIGIPLYAMGWTVRNAGDLDSRMIAPGVVDLGRSVLETGEDLPEGTRGGGLWSMASALGLPARQAGWSVLRDSAAGAVCSFRREEALLLSHEDPLTIRDKQALVIREGLGGIMFWELSGLRDETGGTVLPVPWAD